MSKRRWNARTQMLLTLELAIVLPATALIGYNVWHLRSIQRDRAVEAAIQRDFIHVLKIAEKRMNSQAYKAVEELRSEFPRPNEPTIQKLDRILDRHPEVAHLLLYDHDGGFTGRSQPRRMSDPYFRAECEHLSGFNAWMKIEGEQILQRLRKLEKKDGTPFSFEGYPLPRGDKLAYQNFAIMTLPEWPQERVALGFVMFDGEYLRDHFFPEILDNLLAEEVADPHGSRNSGNAAAMMLHLKKETEPLAASAGWDGGKPEVDRNLEGAFPGLTLAIKFRGTTVEALGQKFLKTSFLIIGGLSVLLAGGIWLTYRNVSKEMALAKLKSDFVANVLARAAHSPLADSPLRRNFGDGPPEWTGEASRVFPHYPEGKRAAIGPHQQYSGLFPHRGGQEGIQPPRDGPCRAGAEYPGILPLPDRAERLHSRGEHRGRSSAGARRPRGHRSVAPELDQQRSEVLTG